jgi:hypothetical protein
MCEFDPALFDLNQTVHHQPSVQIFDNHMQEMSGPQDGQYDDMADEDGGGMSEVLPGGRRAANVRERKRMCSINVAFAVNFHFLVNPPPPLLIGG